MGYKVFLFDFDGTVADTFETAFSIWNVLAKEFRFRPLRVEDLEEVRDMNVRQVMKFLGVPATRLPSIARRGIVELRTRIPFTEPISGMPEVLRTLLQREMRLGLLTSNSAENVQVFCRAHDLELFEFIRTSSRLLGKAREMKSFLRQNRFAAHEVLYIGDEMRDIEAARDVGMPIAAVMWGYNSPRSLRALNPDYVIDEPKGLLELME